ncbi:plasmid partitioning protein RepB (plasmid) [Mesorhizobium mediterraneum]|uniref:Plasmid partitioning protein RepB n=1 Tax=Mesorhizobium mediterraneum TaxID=43617 RepID=A0AB36QYU3_9HYPH|nr:MULTISPECIES: plasmid partitioning protein RepB [Mesorhizobium]PAP97574.1 plasmid partitioning protein RepB [Mesorhizobium mediterraneum]RUU79559.1 plasmid partitioning protein RepB [Mesorhizobium sp. M7A.F.Ca.MR.362.00.0.0]RWN25210.1 MAG: plasmid partitioning protein RepB [Mesorhizobium sp.]RWN29980.1 MAG: plasmid partitioning protein RepB [Mesorhizobium sp.]RWN87449.1 MAG: plasmid partitioning protein RepB [Mesorhizobium sp.]
MSRKDSKGMFAAVLGQLGEENSKENLSRRTSSPHLMKVAAGVRQMQERSDIADKLLKSGEQIIELDPDKIRPSSITDRYDDAYEISAIAEITESMRERGQIVPGLVRPVQGKDGEFQIVYGRRRLAAAKQLGIAFKAAVRELNDEQAVIFQGEENTAREDLSYIEKCAFALAQQEAGYKRDTICASLSTGKSHVSEMIKIASSVDKEILQSIGKAPGIGRGRWQEFSNRYSVEGSLAKAFDLTHKNKFREATSDDRFIMLLETLPAGTNAIKEPAGPAKPSKPKIATKSWAAPDKTVSVSLKDNGKTAVIAVGEAEGSRFAAFIAGQLDDLFEAFRKSTTKQGV